MAADATTRRTKARRLRSETDNAVTESVPFLIDSGLIDLIRFGTIEIVVVDYQVKQIYVKPSFAPKLPTPDLQLT